ncbi:MAG: DNA photolyase family protein [Chloroflexi bacterium]|nr:DNA photolyase family protein [Chloroflexota bacterium]
MDLRRTLAWFRRDLRVGDNRMLEAATRAERAWPVFVVDPDLIAEHDAAVGRRAWFDANMRALDTTLRESGSALTVLHGRPEDVLPTFAAAVGADRVVAGADEDPAAIARDARVATRVDLHLVHDQRIASPEIVRSADDRPYTVFSPFRRALERHLAEAADDPFATADPDLARLARASDMSSADTLPADAAESTRAPFDLPPSGEAAAADRLRAFLRSGLAAYAGDRDRPDVDGTSRISPYLRVGALGIRACWRAATNAAERARERGDAALLRGADAWRGELAWREFFAHVMAANPRVARESFRTEFDAMSWEGGRDADAMLEAWEQGRTGYPFVDAGMRQLVATGWMHNRARLVTASFLVKHLGIDWRTGERVFAKHLLDADVQQNNGNWQWVAGVGTDAAPYFRIFNPSLQAKRFDPDGAYIRAWVPELAAVPDGRVHEPWKAEGPPSGYPSPIVDHAAARERALARYGAVRRERV